MNIAIDYDGTFTADPELWSRFIFDALALGHTVTIVTWRDAEKERITAPIPPVPVIYCSRNAKQNYFHADVVIDDNPASWIQNSH